MSKKKFECDTCDAFGAITHTMDSEFWQVTVCPFCGAELHNNKDSEDDDE